MQTSASNQDATVRFIKFADLLSLQAHAAALNRCLINAECAENAVVMLKRDGKDVETIVTDCYGEFKFDGLKEDSAVYNIFITFEGHEKSLDVELKKSVYWGDLAFRS